MKIGIDLGSSTTLVALMDSSNEPANLISKDMNKKFFTPSVVHINNNIAYVGQYALDIRELNPSIKILQYFKRSFGKIDPLYFDSQGNAWYPEGIAALLLSKVIHDVRIEGIEIEGAVISVPSHFDEDQKKAVIDAAELINLKVLGLIEEPIAAAYHYNLSEDSKTVEKILVYDLGGGTFDATIIESGSSFKILGKEGITDLGGKEFDDKISEIIIRKFEDYLNRKFDNLSALDLLNLRKISESYKMALSVPNTIFHSETVSISGISLEVTVLREEFQDATNHLVSKTIDVCKKCLKSVEVSSSSIDKVLMVGGGSLISSVKDRLKELFNESHQEVLFHEPLKAVSYGAVLFANRKYYDSQSNYDFEELTEYNYGLRIFNASENKLDILTIIQKNRTLPIKKSYQIDIPSNQNHLLLEISRYREHLFRLKESEVELLQEHEIPVKGRFQSVKLEMKLNTSGVLIVTATSNNNPIMNPLVISMKSKNKPYIEEQRQLVKNTIIINQLH